MTVPYNDHTEPSPITTAPYDETEKALSSVSVSSPLTGDGTAGNPITIAASADDWEQVGSILRPIASPTSVQISTTTGNVGINSAPSVTWRNVIGGNTMIDGQRIREKYEFNSETTLTTPNLTAALPWTELVTNLTTTSSQRVRFELFNNGTRLVAAHDTTRVSGSLTFAPTSILAMEMSSLGDRVSGVTVYVGIDGGFLKLAITQPVPSGGTSFVIKILHTGADSSLWTVSPSSATPPAWTSAAAPLTRSRLLSTQAINRFGNIGIEGQIVSAIRTAVATMTATGAVPATATRVLVNNGATNITITLPDPALNIGRELWFTRASTSTGTITLAPAAGQVQALAGTLGATTSITALGSSDSQSVHFFTDGINWYR